MSLGYQYTFNTTAAVVAASSPQENTIAPAGLAVSVAFGTQTLAGPITGQGLAVSTVFGTQSITTSGVRATQLITMVDGALGDRRLTQLAVMVDFWPDQIHVSDSLNVSVLEEAFLLIIKEFTASDTLSLALQETAQVEGRFSASDTLSISLTESATRTDVNWFNFGHSQLIDPDQYPVGTEFRLLVYLYTTDGSFPARARLRNETLGLVVADSELSTLATSDWARLLSPLLALPSGPHTYRVQRANEGTALANMGAAYIEVVT